MMGKKIRSKRKTQVNTQNCESQINIQNSEQKSNQHGSLERCYRNLLTTISRIFLRLQSIFLTKNSQGQINSQDSRPEFLTQGFDCLNEDGILCSIISSLRLREAGRTCVLSHKWKHTWTYLPILNFDPENIFDSKTLDIYESLLSGKDTFCLLLGKLFGKDICRCYFLLKNTDYFIQTVNSVLQQHQGRARVLEINIRYFLHKAHSNHLDAWIRFAVASKTKHLYLNLRQRHSNFNNVELYDFPFHLLASSAIEELYLVCCNLKPPYQFDCLNRLRELVLWHLSGTGEDINNLVSHCSSLDRLDVVGSKELTILNIPHTLSKLFSLTVEKCDHLKEIRIDAVNLKCISYKGVPLDFVLRQPSCIQQARIYFKVGRSDYNVNFYLTKLASDLPRLNTLNLNIDGVFKVENLSKCCPRFTHLKRLEWESVGVKMSLLDLDTLLDAAPILKELRLQLSTCGDEEPHPRVTMLKKKLPKNPRPHLKVIKISGFYFERWQVQIVLYLLKNAIKLVLMELEKDGKPGKGSSWADMKCLIQQVPPNVEFIIL